jgi:hypothetical protein
MILGERFRFGRHRGRAGATLGASSLLSNFAGSFLKPIEQRINAANKSSHIMGGGKRSLP